MRAFLGRRWPERDLQEQSYIVAIWFIGAGACLGACALALLFLGFR